MAATRLRELGLESAEASALAAALEVKMGLMDPDNIDATLNKYALETPLSAADWASCFAHCPELLDHTTEVLAAALKQLQHMFKDDQKGLVAAALECPALLLHEYNDTELKVQYFQQHCSILQEQGLTAAQVLSRLSSHAPGLLTLSIHELQAQVRYLAAVLDVGEEQAVRLLYEEPGIAERLEHVTAASSGDDVRAPATQLEQRMALVKEPSASNDAAEARELVLCQPELLTGSVEGLQDKLAVVPDTAGADHTVSADASQQQAKPAAQHDVDGQSPQEPGKTSTTAEGSLTPTMAASFEAAEFQQKEGESPTQPEEQSNQGTAEHDQTAAELAASSITHQDADGTALQAAPEAVEPMASDLPDAGSQEQAAANVGSGPADAGNSQNSKDPSSASAATSQPDGGTKAAGGFSQAEGTEQLTSSSTADPGSPARQAVAAQTASAVADATCAAEGQPDHSSVSNNSSRAVSPDSPSTPPASTTGPLTTAESATTAADRSASPAHVAAAEGSASATDTGIAEVLAGTPVTQGESTREPATAAAQTMPAEQAAGTASPAKTNSPAATACTVPPPAVVDQADAASADRQPEDSATAAELAKGTAETADSSHIAASSSTESPATEQSRSVRAPATKTSSPVRQVKSRNSSPAKSSADPSQAAGTAEADSSAVSSAETERREAFMKLLLSKVPTYAVTLLGTDQADKLQFLSHMKPADLSAVLAQPQAEELLEAVYAVHLKNQQQQHKKAPTSTPAQAAGTPSKKPVSGASSKAAAPASAAGPSKAAGKPGTSTAKPDAAAEAIAGYDIITDRGRKYLFVTGTVCGVCGSRGHVGGVCRTAACPTCKVIGHPAGKCGEACRVCGKRHRPGPCTTPHCHYCKLFGHEFEQCPTAHCKKCSYYGHVPSLCPIAKDQQATAGGSEVSIKTKAATPAAAAAATAALNPGSAATQPATGRTAASAADNSNAVRSSSSAAAPRPAPVAPPLPARAAPRPAAPVAALAVQQKVPGQTMPSSAVLQQAPARQLVASTGPAAAAPSASAGPAKRGLLVQDGSKTYLFQKSVVCSNCGKPGHLGSVCDAYWCSKCNMFGHRYGECHEACQTCGRRHAFTRGGGAPVCYTPHCGLCNKFSHTADECPSAKCSGCGYWGHLRSGCPLQQQPAPVEVAAGRVSNSLQQQQYSNAQRSAAAAMPSSAVGTSRYGPVDGAAAAGSRSSLDVRQVTSLSRSADPAASAGVTSPTAVPGSGGSSSGSKWFTFTDSGRQYKCHQYPACNKCGTVGHLPSACTTPYCSSCGMYGHRTGSCHTACETCGKPHEGSSEGCYMPLCPHCRLYGHIGKHCPSAQCQLCGYFGHILRICPDQYAQKPSSHGAVSSSSRIGDPSRQPLAATSGFGAGSHSSRPDYPDRSAHVSSSSSRVPVDSWSQGPAVVSRGVQPDEWIETRVQATSSRRAQAGFAANTNKQYRFVGKPVCGRCGRSGHLAGDCHSEYCNDCQKWGHETGACMYHCRKCGKNHARGGCSMLLCPKCQLWGHAAKHCPTVQCSLCGYWGHDSRICPDEAQQGSSVAARYDATAQRQLPSSGRGARYAGTPARPAGVTDASRAERAGHRASAAAARALTGNDSGAWSPPVNAPEDSWDDNGGTGNSDSALARNAAADSTYEVEGWSNRAASSRSSTVRQFKLEPPAATEEEVKIRSARLVHSLFSSMPEYASGLLGDKDRLACLARLSAADLEYIAAQPHPEELLEELYSREQVKSQHQQATSRPARLQQLGYPKPHGTAPGRGDVGVKTAAARHQAAAVPGPPTPMDSTNILTQQMAATLAGFKRGPGRQQQQQTGASTRPLHVAADSAPAGLMPEYSDEEDMSHMLGLLVAGR